MEFSALIGRRLLSLRLMSVGTHPAWVDNSTPQIATYAVTLELGGDVCVQVRPCEVAVQDKYPALAIELHDWSGPVNVQRWARGEYEVRTPEEIKALLPTEIRDVRLWDSMGDGVVSALDLLLSNGVTFTLRHVFPPMMLGVDVHTGDHHEP